MVPIMQAPVAKKIPVTNVYHETRILQDDYAWLKQDNWKEMFRDTSLLLPEIRDYLEAENSYTENNFISPNQPLIDTLVEEMKARTEINYDTAPVQRGEYFYFSRYSEADYPVFLRRDLDGNEQVLLDVNTELAGDGQKVFLGSLRYSPNQNWLAISVDYSGAEDYEILIKDLKSGQFLATKLAHAAESIWAPDSKKFYYTRMTDTPGEFRRDRIFCHTLGQDQSQDILVFTSNDADYYLQITQTNNQRFLLVTLENSAISELHVLDMKDEQAEFICPAPKSDEIQYEMDYSQDRFFILTNADDATEFRIMTAVFPYLQRTHWQEYIPHKPGRFISKIRAFSDHLVRSESEGGLPHIRVTNLEKNATHSISFDDPAYDVRMDNAAGFYSPWLRLVYTSPRIPAQYINYHMETKERILIREEKITGHNPDKYVVERIFIPGHDNAQIPLTITRRIDTPLDGSAPLRLYGYGSYGNSLPSMFGRYNYRYPIMDRGFICVDAHIRGGADMGRHWYLNGKLQHKRNSFLDFISAAEWLIENNYTAPGKIAIEGRSAGGLLVGAAVNMAEPGLLGCVIAGVPFVDVMNTILDEKLPLTPPEWQEWGNPVADPDAFDYMASYSPYDNITRKPYPPMFIHGGLTDPRVTYWEPAKWVAKLRDYKQDDNNIFLHIAMDSGHGGDPGRFSHLPEIARELAFMMVHLQK